MKMQVDSWGIKISTPEENQEFNGYPTVRNFAHWLTIVRNTEMILYLDA